MGDKSVTLHVDRMGLGFSVFFAGSILIGALIVWALHAILSNRFLECGGVPTSIKEYIYTFVSWTWRVLRMPISEV